MIPTIVFDIFNPPTFCNLRRVSKAYKELCDKYKTYKYLVHDTNITPYTSIERKMLSCVMTKNIIWYNYYIKPYTIPFKEFVSTNGFYDIYISNILRKNISVIIDNMCHGVEFIKVYYRISATLTYELNIYCLHNVISSHMYENVKIHLISPAVNDNWFMLDTLFVMCATFEASDVHFHNILNMIIKHKKYELYIKNIHLIEKHVEYNDLYTALYYQSYQIFNHLIVKFSVTECHQLLKEAIEVMNWYRVKYLLDYMIKMHYTINYDQYLNLSPNYNDSMIVLLNYYNNDNAWLQYCLLHNDDASLISKYGFSHPDPINGYLLATTNRNIYIAHYFYEVLIHQNIPVPSTLYGDKNIVTCRDMK